MEMQQIMEMLAEMRADQKTKQEKKDTNLKEMMDDSQAKMLAKMKEGRRANWEEMLAKMDATQEKIEADREERKQEIRAGQEQMASLVSLMDTHQEKMEAATDSIRSELDEKIQH
jgi:hypothetical protein